MLLFPIVCMGQKKVYTKGMKIGDFTTRTTKVVLSGESMLDLCFKDEVSAQWNISAYEFCPVAEYEKFKEDNNYYFLRLVSDGEVNYISLSKGGKEKEENSLKRPFELVRVPISTTQASDGRVFVYMPAFVSIVQAYMEKALVNEVAAYTGLTAFNGRIPKDAKVLLEPAEADAAFADGAQDTLIGLMIGKFSMLIEADTHKLVYYSSTGRDLAKKYGKSAE